MDVTFTPKGSSEPTTMPLSPVVAEALCEQLLRDIEPLHATLAGHPSMETAMKITKELDGPRVIKVELEPGSYELDTSSLPIEGLEQQHGFLRGFIHGATYGW